LTLVSEYSAILSPASIDASIFQENSPNRSVCWLSRRQRCG
jgi:hypothetical protein